MRPFGSKTELVKFVSMILTVPVKSGWMLRSVPLAPKGLSIADKGNLYIQASSLKQPNVPPN